jgi:hypothetical protein
MVALKSYTVSGSSTATVTFDLTTVTGNYTDLRLVINSQNANSTYQPYIQFNSDTSGSSTNYSTTSLRGDGSSAASGRHTSNFGWYPVPGPGVGTTGNFEPWLIDIMNYSNTTTYKTGLSRFNNSASIVAANVHLWRSTAAITSISITAESGSGNFVAGSTFTLYGIANADIGAYATGGIITQDSTYYYHAFGSSGTFTPSRALTADILVVAGGGAGGGTNAGGGGGAGGLLYQTGRSLTNGTGYTCTIGAGGGATTVNGSNGSNSSFDIVVANGGGGGSYNGTPNSFTAGGSGGGGAYNASGGGSANQGNSSGATGLGNNGAGGNNSGNQGAGGGGGAGSTGSVGTSSNGGAGGAGYTSSLLAAMAAATGYGASNYFAGGGGGGLVYGTSGSGGAGGSGGGGTGGIYGSPTVAATSGTSYTGGGGGGSGAGSTAGNGGSGLIIVRYAK